MGDMNETCLLSSVEQSLLTRLVDRIFPDDGDGHVASRIGVVSYILGALAGPDRGNLALYRDLLAWSQDRLGPLPSARDLDAAIGAMEGGQGPADAFPVLRRDVIRGLFSDPIHGGNRDKSGWRFLGHPGLIFPTTPADPTDRSDRRLFDGQTSLADLPPKSNRSLPPDFDPDAGLSDPVRDADVVIVGCGAVGAMVASWLAADGLTVVVLEAGVWRTSSDFQPDELSQAFYGRGELGPKFNAETPRWVPSADQTHGVPMTFSLGRMANGVGGSSALYGARFRRFHPHHFRHLTTVRDQGRQASLPPDHALVDWPITYDDLEPFYSEMETLIGVAGEASPFIPRSAPMPERPLPDFPAGLQFSAAARALGLCPLRVPVGRRNAADKGLNPSFSPWDEGIGSDAPNRWTPLLDVLPAGLATKRLHLRTRCRVMRIVTDPFGRATGVRYRDPDGTEKVQLARKVIVAAYTFETVRLLALSRSAAHPSGLGNSSGQLGKCFMTKMFPQVVGQFDSLHFNRHLGPGGQAVIVEDLITEGGLAGGIPNACGFVGGGTMSTENQYLPLQIGQDLLPQDIMSWGPDLKRHLRGWNSRLAVKIQADALPTHANSLILDPYFRDPETGDPVVRVIWSLPENDRRLYLHMQDRAAALLKQMGAVRIWKGPVETGIGSCHDLGGCRSGADPADTVVDVDWQVHDTPNLYVFGGASFPTCPGINPTLTIWAWARRNARKMARTMR